MQLRFTFAHTTLSVIDNVNGNQWKFTGQCSLKMVAIDVVSSTKTAAYTLTCGNEIIQFSQQDINKIAGSDPNGTPATDFTSIAALLPLYT